MGEFFKSKAFKFILAVVAVLLGMMLYSATTQGVASLPKNILTFITTPFQKASAYVSNATGDFFDRFLNSKNIYNENQTLRQEVDKLNQKLVDFEQLKDENEQLREVAGIKDKYPDLTITTASVVSRDPADRYSSFVIDKGSLHGVSLHDPVMTTSGLIGIVVEVSKISARVQTILSPEINISSFEISSKELGVLSGDIKLSKNGECKLSILSEVTTLKRDDMIVTAGSTGKYPKGIPIGKVLGVYSETHGFTKYAIIKPLDDVENVSSVQVITNFQGKGSELLDNLHK